MQPVNTSALSTELEPLYSVSDLQKWSGESESIWRKRISRGEIRTIKFGANTRIPKSALDQYLRSRERAS
jgi:excisionase family DNA binding protein